MTTPVPVTDKPAPPASRRFRLALSLRYFVLLWLIAIAIGIAAVNDRRTDKLRTTQIEYVATREMAKNHRIVAGDLTIPSNLPGELYNGLPERATLESHYLLSDVKKPRLFVNEKLVSTFPTLSAGEQADGAVPASGSPFVYSLEGKAQLVALLDAGMKARLGDTEGTVRAVICGPVDPQKGPVCYAVFDVPKEKAEKLWNTGQTVQVIPEW